MEKGVVYYSMYLSILVLMPIYTIIAFILFRRRLERYGYTSLFVQLFASGMIGLVCYILTIKVWYLPAIILLAVAAALILKYKKTGIAIAMIILAIMISISGISYNKSAKAVAERKDIEAAAKAEQQRKEMAEYEARLKADYEEREAENEKFHQQLEEARVARERQEQEWFEQIAAQQEEEAMADHQMITELTMSLDEWVDFIKDAYDHPYDKEAYSNRLKNNLMIFANVNNMHTDSITMNVDDMNEMHAKVIDSLGGSTMASTSIDDPNTGWQNVDDEMYPDWSSDMYETELGDYQIPQYYASDSEYCCATTDNVVVNSDAGYANIRTDPSTDSQVKHTYENGRTLDYLGDSVQDGSRIWYHVGYYVWNGNNPIYKDGWISSNVCEAYI